MHLFKSQSYRPFLSCNFSAGRLAPSLRRLSRGVREVATSPEVVSKDADYEEALAILNRYQRYPSAPPDEPARDRAKSWLSLLGYDVDRLQTPKIIHVAGTKGKGTTCNYISRMLVEHQRMTGYPKKIICLTSPHKIDVRERILINNEKIPKTIFSDRIRRLHTKLQSLASRPDLKTPWTPRFPAFMSILGMLYSLENLEKDDVMVIETGMGGEMDSTNVFPHPIATGITSIGIDHVHVLGDTVEKIAWHKAGIFKSNSVAGTVVQDQAVLNVLRQRAKEKRVAGELQVITDRKVIELGVKVDPDMPYQRSNLALAIFLTETLLKSENPKFSITPDIARSVQDVVLLGRSQIVENGDITWFITSATNDISLRETLSWFKTHSKRHITAPRVLLFNKNYSKVSRGDPIPLLRIIHEALCAETPVVLQGVVFCTDYLDEIGMEKPDSIDFRMDRKAISSLDDQRANSKTWKELGGSGDTFVAYTTKAAVRLIQQKYKGAEVLVVGSGFLASNVLQILQSSGLRI